MNASENHREPIKNEDIEMSSDSYTDINNSSHNTSPNFISSLTKANSQSKNDISDFDSAKKIKKIPQNKKKEITINLIELPDTEETKDIIKKNYNYLWETFSDKEDDFSQILSKNKLFLTEEAIEQFLTETQNRHFSFGEEPTKIFKELIYEQCTSAQKKNKISPVDHIQNIAATLPVLEGPKEVLEELDRNYYPIFMYSQSQINKIKNSTMSSGKKNTHSNSVCECCAKANKDGIECECKCSYSESKDKHYNCAFCSCKFSSPQGLGGHMSRTHSSQSLNFLKKREIRNQREPQRRLLEESKKILCENHNKNYYNLLKTRQGKDEIKRLISMYPKEYRSIRKKFKTEKI